MSKIILHRAFPFIPEIVIKKQLPHKGKNKKKSSIRKGNFGKIFIAKQKERTDKNMKNTRLAKGISILKVLLIAVLIFSAGYIAFAVPESVKSFLPAVKTVRAERCEYKPFITAKGRIVKGDEGCFAVVAVNEADISKVERGQSVQLSGAALPDGVYCGSVSGISDTAYTLTLGTAAAETVVDVTVMIDMGDTSLLRSGYSVTAQLKTGDERILTTLPYTAVYQDDKGEFVYILKNGTAARRDIVTGMELSDRTEILSGIDEGDIVLEEAEGVSDGGRVRAVK